MIFRTHGEEIEDFDVRGDLYALTSAIAPEARRSDLDLMRRWIAPRTGERVADLAAGTGFLTRALATWVETPVLAIDPSHAQLNHLMSMIPTAQPVVMGSDDPALLSHVEQRDLDLVTSFGGLHHATNHHQLMRNIDGLLKPGGRCVVGDIEDGSALARHFDEVVAQKCLTGHKNITWWSRGHIERVIEGTRLTLVRSELITNHMWTFNTEAQLALFFRALHAYDLPDAEIIADLKATLGVREVAGKIQLSWPMYLFELKKL